MDFDKPQDLRDIYPTSFNQIIGQESVKKALQVAVDASFVEHKRLDDVLLCGPPGLGKSGLVTVLQHELGLDQFTTILAQSITNVAELNSVLLSAREGILFLDEVHLLSNQAQHTLLKVLDFRKIDINTGKTVTSIPVSEFTLIMATTDLDAVIAPLVDRCRLVLHLSYYSHSEIETIVQQRLTVMGWSYEPELLPQIAKRSRQTPRIALRLLQSARRWQLAEGSQILTVGHLYQSCEVEGISSLGLDRMQQDYLQQLGDCPLRLNVISSMLGVSNKVISKTVEPFLLRSGLVTKSDAGVRNLTEAGQNHLQSFCPISVNE